MKLSQKIADWLEIRWLTPSYSGWLLLVLALCFFGAASNTMAGWLYAISGVILALLVVNGGIVLRSLAPIKVHRHPITPVSAGDDLTITLEIENVSKTEKTLLEIWDFLPYVLQEPKKKGIEVIAPNSSYQWVYYVPTRGRGVYRWQEVHLRTGTPLGLMYCRRRRQVPAKAIVYPQVLTLKQCPLVDTIGSDDSNRLPSNQRYLAATEGITRTLRNYRYGDSMRLIHWRTSARLGEFRVRELEVITGGQEVIIALDSGSKWEKQAFEMAVIAAASLYFYASRSQLNVQLWTAESGLVHGNWVVLETLAAVAAEEDIKNDYIPSVPLIWITQNISTLETLALQSRCLFFTSSNSEDVPLALTQNLSGLIINLQEPLQPQLQKSWR